MSTELTADETQPEPDPRGIMPDEIDRLVERLVGLLAGSTIAGLEWSVDYYPAQPTEEKSVVAGETALVYGGQRDRVAVTITAPPGTLPAVAQAEGGEAARLRRERDRLAMARFTGGGASTVARAVSAVLSSLETDVEMDPVLAEVLAAHDREAGDARH